MKNILRNRLAVGAVIAMTLSLVASPAFATGYTGVPSADAAQASTDILAFLATMVSAVAPVFLALAGGIVGITILAWGVSTVFHKVRGAAHF